MWQRALSGGGGGKEYSYQTANISAGNTKTFNITDGYYALYASDNTWSYAHGYVDDNGWHDIQNVNSYASWVNGVLTVTNPTNKTFVLGAFITDTWS